MGRNDPGGSMNAHRGPRGFKTSTEVQNGKKMLKIEMFQMLSKTPSMHRYRH
jgi:hypothetical protein